MKQALISVRELNRDEQTHVLTIGVGKCNSIPSRALKRDCIFKTWMACILEVLALQSRPSKVTVILKHHSNQDLGSKCRNIYLKVKEGQHEI